jgi:hypothetical protein
MNEYFIYKFIVFVCTNVLLHCVRIIVLFRFYCIVL